MFNSSSLSIAGIFAASLSAFLLGGCIDLSTNDQDALSSIATRAVNNRNQACMRLDFPFFAKVQGGRVDTSLVEHWEKLEALSELGLLDHVDTTRYGMTIRAYSFSSMAQAFIFDHIDADDDGRQRMNTTLCYGNRVPVSIDRVSLIDNPKGTDFARIEYRYRVEDVESWALGDRFRKAFPREGGLIEGKAEATDLIYEPI